MGTAGSGLLFVVVGSGLDWDSLGLRCMVVGDGLGYGNYEVVVEGRR